MLWLMEHRDDDGNELDLEFVIAEYDTHRLPLIHDKQSDRYYLGQYGMIINGKRDGKWKVNPQYQIGVTGATLVYDFDEVVYGDVCDETYKTYTVAWDWDEYGPVIQLNSKHGSWYIHKISGNQDNIEKFKNKYATSLVDDCYEFGEEFAYGILDICNEFPGLTFSGYYNICTNNADPHDFYQAIIWNKDHIEKIGQLFEIDDGFNRYAPVFESDEVTIKEMKVIEKN